MTDAPLTTQRPLLTMVGDPAAEACEGEFCVIPVHPEHGIMNRRLDDDRV